jgi:DNA-binding CsgD family transcriptional regulator
MPASQRLRLHKVRQVHELVQRISEVGDRPEVWRRLALEGLIRILGGTVGLTVDIELTAAGIPQMIDPIDIGWQSESVRQRFGQYAASGEMAADPGATTLLKVQRERQVIVRTRRELIDDATWYRSPCVSEARRMGQVDDFVIASTAAGPGATHGLIVYRAWGETPFEPRHRRLMQLFRLELTRAIRASTQLKPIDGPLPHLSPRQRQTLDLMLSPMTLSQIAAHLGISRHTINDYQKALYRIFQVKSRPELLSRFPAPRRAIRLPHSPGAPPAS